MLPFSNALSSIILNPTLFLSIVLIFSCHSQSKICVWNATGSADEYNGEYTYIGQQLGYSYWRKPTPYPGCDTPYHYLMYVAQNNKNYWVFGEDHVTDYVDGQFHCDDTTQPTNPMDCVVWKDSMSGQATSYSISISNGSCPSWPCDRVRVSNTGSPQCDHEFIKHDTIDNAYVYNTNEVYFYFNELAFRYYCSTTFGYDDCDPDPQIKHFNVSSLHDGWYDLDWGQSVYFDLDTQSKGDATTTVLCLAPTTSPTNDPTASPSTPWPTAPSPSPSTPVPTTPSPITASPITASPITASPITSPTKTPVAETTAMPTITDSEPPTTLNPTISTAVSTTKSIQQSSTLLTGFEFTPSDDIPMETMTTTEDAHQTTTSTSDSEEQGNTDTYMHPTQRFMDSFLGQMAVYIGGGLLFLGVSTAFVCCCVRLLRKRNTDKQTPKDPSYAEEVHSGSVDDTVDLSIEMQSSHSVVASTGTNSTSIGLKEAASPIHSRSVSKRKRSLFRSNRKQKSLNQDSAMHATTEGAAVLSLNRQVTPGRDILSEILSTPERPAVAPHAGLLQHNGLQGRNMQIVEDDQDDENDELWDAGTEAPTVGDDNRTAGRSMSHKVTTTDDSVFEFQEKLGEADVYMSENNLDLLAQGEDDTYKSPKSSPFYTADGDGQLQAHNDVLEEEEYEIYEVAD